MNIPVIGNIKYIQNFNVYTGIRSETPLTIYERNTVISYLKKFDFDLDKVIFSDHYRTAYNEKYDAFTIGTDVKPSEHPRVGTLYANQRVSLKATLAHEIIGHREAHLKGHTHFDPIYEEVQASIRAARFAPDLTNIERITLLRDARARLGNEAKLKDIKDKLFIEEE